MLSLLSLARRIVLSTCTLEIVVNDKTKPVLCSCTVIRSRCATRPSSCLDRYFTKTKSLWVNRDSNLEDLPADSEVEIEAASVEEIVADSVVALEEAIEVVSAEETEEVSAVETEEVSEVHPEVDSDETITNSN